MSSCRSSSTSSKQRDHFAMERRPRMLKDFLIEEANSCPSSGFKTFPRRVKQDHDSVRNLIQMDLNHSNSSSTSSNARSGSTLQRSRSRAATVTISAFQAFINSVKSIQFITAAAKSPPIVPRSLSRRLSKKNNHHAQNSTDQVEKFTTVKIKDIIRWKSFRDLVMEEEEEQQKEEKPQPSDPLQSTTTTASSTGYSTNTSCSSSNGSSWCDSDFTSEYLPSWFENEAVDEVGKKYSPSSCSVGRGSMEATTESPATSAVGPKVKPNYSVDCNLLEKKKFVSAGEDPGVVFV